MNPSVWDLQQMLKSERKACQSLNESISQWKNIVEGMGASTPDVNALESEWKVRYENQNHYNRMLIQEIQNMRRKLRTLRMMPKTNRPTDDDEKTLLTNAELSVTECKRKIRSLQVEKCSLMSQQDMYEKQLDIESMDYYKIRERLLRMAKDVGHHHGSWIQAQEQADQHSLSVFKKSPRKLKAVATALVRPFKRGPTQLAAIGSAAKAKTSPNQTDVTNSSADKVTDKDTCNQIENQMQKTPPPPHSPPPPPTTTTTTTATKQSEPKKMSPKKFSPRKAQKPSYGQRHESVKRTQPKTTMEPSAVSPSGHVVIKKESTSLDIEEIENEKHVTFNFDNLEAPFVD